MTYNPIERWEWEGGATPATADHDGAPRPEDVRERPTKPAAHAVADGSAVELDDLQPPPPAGRVRFDDVSDAPPEQRRPDRRFVRDVADRRVALA